MITGKRAEKLGDDTWETLRAEGIQEEVGTQLDRIYIERRQKTVVQWVELRPLFEVCAREIGYEGRRGGAKRRRKNNFRPPWQTRGKLKGGGGALGRWVCSRTANAMESKSGLYIDILGRR